MIINEKKERQFIPIGSAEVFTGIKQQTLRKLFDGGVLQGYKTNTEQRMYSKKSLCEFCGIVNGENKENVKKAKIIYTRVSSKKQLDDLDRQINFIVESKPEYNEYTIIKDVASGINFKRKGLATILERCLQGVIGEVVVAHRDRLSRFGFDLIKFIIEKSGGKLTVINDEKEKSSEQELAEDLLSIVHIYSCRQMGKRIYSNKSKDIDVTT